MPFIKQEDRERLAKPGELPQTPGEECYLHYKEMMKIWELVGHKWSTADMIASYVFPEFSQDRRAEFLAFIVFFNLHAMPYEILKRKQNGEVK